jgi:anaerobic magnesium-protoporphyrin IX monomethyl ester cyclase
MEIRSIACIQLGGVFPDLCYRTVMPDYGMPLIGTILSEAGYDVRVYMEHIAPPDWERIARTDLVCFSSLNAGADKVYRLADEIKARLGIPIIIGGTHATYFPESCLEHCDYVVMGEGDDAILELVKTLDSGGDVPRVAGVAYRRGNEIHRNAARPGPARFDTVPDFSLIEGYRAMGWLDVVRQRRVSWIPVQSSRGCHFKCSFCIVNTMFPDGYRKRDIQSVIRDLRDKRRYGSELLFVDNDFAANRADTKKLLRAIIAEDFGFNIMVFARVEIARDDELLSLMRQAGIRLVYQGYESVQPQTLQSYNKHQTMKQIIAAANKVQEAGLRVAGSFVLGADTDTQETMDRTVDFVIDTQLAMAYFFPIWGHFAEQINGYRTIVPRHRSIFRGWPYCDGNFVTHFPLNMPPSKLQLAVITAYRRVFSIRQALTALKRGDLWTARWRLMHNIVWRDIEPALREHATFLEGLEDGLYSFDGRLREDALAERVRQDPRWIFPFAMGEPKSPGVSPLELPIPGKQNITCVPPKFQEEERPSNLLAGE